MIKHVPGRKTDLADSEWLAVLVRFGLVRSSFIPPRDLRELRLVSRYRRKLTAMCASEINRLQKISAAMMPIEIGDDMSRFDCAERIASWAALSPGNNKSADKRKSGRTRHGNAIIRYVLCECANAARHTKSTQPAAASH